MNIRFLLAILFLLLFSFIVFRIIVRHDYLRKGKISFFSLLLEIAIFGLHANSIYFFIPEKWPDLPSLSKNPLIYYISLFFILSGLVIVLISMASLGYYRTMGLKVKGLKTDGLYRFTRNPQIIGYALFLMGFALSYPSLHSLLWLITYGIIAHLMVLTEEEFLQKIYGKKYQDYCEQVPRYFRIKLFI